MTDLWLTLFILLYCYYYYHYLSGGVKLRRHQSHCLIQGGRRRIKKMTDLRFKTRMQRHTGLEIDRDLPTHVDTIVSAQFGKISFDDRISSSLLFSTETERCGILEIMLPGHIQEIIVITLQAHIPLHSFPQESVSQSTQSVEHHLHFYYEQTSLSKWQSH